ncbi:MAG: 30S ribosome-binding factor RbfA [Beggiatoa sp.]|nr:30S ribosome-binding factor RbfA [Beggiatoa sp.]
MIEVGTVRRARGGEDRTLRIAALIQRTLAPLLQAEARERRLGLLCITGVAVSPDLRHAKVYVSALSGGVPDPIARIQRRVGRYRAHVAKALRLRVVPRLVIVADDTQARAARINALLAGSNGAPGAASVDSAFLINWRAS